MLEKKAKQLARDSNCPFADNELPYGRAEQGHPVKLFLTDFYHEEVRGFGGYRETAKGSLILLVLLKSSQAQ